MASSGNLLWRFIGGTIGFYYGVTLLIMGFILHGSGEGTMTPLMVFCAPVSIINHPLIICISPVFWAVLGTLVAAKKEEHQSGNKLFLLLIISHYVGAIIATGANKDDAAYLERAQIAMPWLTVAAIAFYLVGQAAIWVLMTRQFKSVPPS